MSRIEEMKQEIIEHVRVNPGIRPTQLQIDLNYLSEFDENRMRKALKDLIESKRIRAVAENSTMDTPIYLYAAEA